MKELTLTKKHAIIKSFLCGDSYDETAKQIGVAKGSVVNVIDAFSQGELTVLPGMTGYIDELRHLVVDLKKHSITVPQLKTYVKIHAKLKSMGVMYTQVDQWLDVCQEMAKPIGSHFAQAALELAQAVVETGFSYQSVNQDYQAKLTKVKGLETQIKQQEQKLAELKQQNLKAKEQAAGELKSIKHDAVAAQEDFNKQKEEMKNQMEHYIAQHKLTKKKVDTAYALLSPVLAEKGLNQAAIGEVSNGIAASGSLYIFKNELAKEAEQLKGSVERLHRREQELKVTVGQLRNMNEKLCQSIASKGQQEKELDTRLANKSSQLSTVKDTVAGYINDIRNTHSIIAFLLSPEHVKNSEIDWLAGLMVWIGQQRLGLPSYTVKDNQGKVICQCQPPQLFVNTDDYIVNQDEARKRLALYLVPLVQEKFMPRWEYESDQLQKVYFMLKDIEYSLDELK